MPTQDTRFHSPLRVFEKALDGGLGAGEIGVVLSRPGVGKTALLVGMAVDALLQGRSVLHISTEESVREVRRFYDEVFERMADNLKLDNRMQRQLDLERNRHILVYNRKEFSLEKLRQSVAFLAEAADFRPQLVIMDGTPRYEHTEQWEIDGVRELARDLEAAVWTSSLLHRDGQETDERGVPRAVARFDADLSVIVVLEPERDHVQVRVVKATALAGAAAPRLELDPRTLLLRWR